MKPGVGWEFPGSDWSAPEAFLNPASWHNEPDLRKLVIITDGSDPKTAPIEVRILPDTPLPGK